MQDEGQPSPNAIEPTAVMQLDAAASSDTEADMHVIIAVQPETTAGHTPAGSIEEICDADMQLLAFISWTSSWQATEQIAGPDMLVTDARQDSAFDTIDGRLVVRQSLSQKPLTADITSAFCADSIAIDDERFIFRIGSSATISACAHAVFRLPTA